MMDAEQLIDAVHEYECLWNVKNSGYKDRKMHGKRFLI